MNPMAVLRLTINSNTLIDEEYNDWKYTDEDGINWAHEPGFRSELPDDWAWERTYGIIFEITIDDFDEDYHVMLISPTKDTTIFDYKQFLEDYAIDPYGELFSAGNVEQHGSPSLRFEDYDEVSLIGSMAKQGWHLYSMTNHTSYWTDLIFKKSD